MIIEWFYTPLGGVQRRGGWCGEEGVDGVDEGGKYAGELF